MVLSLEELQKLRDIDRNKYFRELIGGLDNNVKEYEKMYQKEWINLKNSGQIYNEEQINFFKKRADNENCKCSAHFLGLLYFHGLGVEKNNDISDKYFNMAVERNFGLAYNSVGFSFYEKNEYKKAKEYWELAIKYGCQMAISNLGLLYLYGYGVEKDSEKAYNLFKSVSENDYPTLMTNLGYMYIIGTHVTRDNNKAIELYKLAAEHGEKNAASYLGSVYEYGFSVSKDIVKAIHYYKLSENYSKIKHRINILVEENDMKTLELIMKDMTYVKMVKIYDEHIPEILLDLMNKVQKSCEIPNDEIEI